MALMISTTQLMINKIIPKDRQHGKNDVGSQETIGSKHIGRESLNRVIRESAYSVKNQSTSAKFVKCQRQNANSQSQPGFTGTVEMFFVLNATDLVVHQMVAEVVVSVAMNYARVHSVPKSLNLCIRG